MALHVSGDSLTHHQEYNALYVDNSGEIGPTRCNNCVFVLRIGFTFSGRQSHPSSGVHCCIWPFYWGNQSNRMPQLRFYSPQWLYSTCFGVSFTHHHEYNSVYGHYSGEISPTRCNNCVFILRNVFPLHVSGDNFTNH